MYVEVLEPTNTNVLLLSWKQFDKRLKIFKMKMGVALGEANKCPASR